MSELSQTTLTDGELASALRAAGLQATRASPLSALPKADSLDGAALRHKGLLSKTGQLLPAWQTTLGVVADPAARLDLTLCEALDRLETSYYAADGVVASHVQLEGNHRLAPAERAEISEAIGGWLLLDGVPEPKTPLSCKLSAAELLALSALADAYREDQLRAFLVRRASRVLAFSLQTLWRQAQSGLDQRDPRWLCGLLALAAPPAFSTHPKLLEGGLDSLVRRGWIRQLADQWEIMPEAQRYCFALCSTTPSLRIAGGAAGQALRTALVIRALNAFWLLDFSPAESPEVVVINTGGGKLTQAFVSARIASLECGADQHALAASPTDAVAISVAEPEVRMQKPAGTAVKPPALPPPLPRLQPAAVASPVRPAPKPQPTAARPAAASPLPPTKPVAAPPAKPPASAAERLCPKCQRPVAAGKKFCTHDGTPVP